MQYKDPITNSRLWWPNPYIAPFRNKETSIGEPLHERRSSSPVLPALFALVIRLLEKINNVVDAMNSCEASVPVEGVVERGIVKFFLALSGVCNVLDR